MDTPPIWIPQPKNYHPSSTNNNAANFSRTAVKFEIQLILNLINAFVHRKRAYGRDRRGKRGYTGQTRCTRLWYTPNHVATPVGRPAAENHCAYVSAEAIAYTRKPASRMDLYTRYPRPCTNCNNHYLCSESLGVRRQVHRVGATLVQCRVCQGKQWTGFSTFGLQ